MKIKKFTPYILLIVMLVSITILLMAILKRNGYSSADVLEGRQPVVSTNTNIEEPHTADTDTQIKRPYHTTYPKSASASDSFLYVQQLSGEGDVKVKNVLQTTLSHYVITESDCEYGDATVKNNSLVVFLLDVVGTVNKMLPLSARLPLTYVDSAITSKGLIIVGKTSEYLYLYTVAYELDVYECETYPLSYSAKIFPTDVGFLLFSKGEQNVLYYTDETSNVAFLPSGEIVDTYDFSSYISVFLNTASGYSILKYNKKLQCIEETRINGCTLLDVAPIVENSSQKYIAIEKGFDSTSVRKYDANYTSSAISVPLGAVDEAQLIRGKNKLLVALTGKIRGIYTLTYDLQFTVSNSDIFTGVTKFYSEVEHKNGFLFLVKIGEELRIIDLRNDDSSVSKLIAERAENAFFRLNVNGTVSIFYDVTDGYSKTCIVGTAQAE